MPLLSTATGRVLEANMLSILLINLWVFFRSGRDSCTTKITNKIVPPMSVHIVGTSPYARNTQIGPKKVSKSNMRPVSAPVSNVGASDIVTRKIPSPPPWATAPHQYCQSSLSSPRQYAVGNTSPILTIIEMVAESAAPSAAAPVRLIFLLDDLLPLRTIEI